MVSVIFYHDRPWLLWQLNLGSLCERWLELGLHKRYVVVVVVAVVAVAAAAAAAV